jgi:hypothetical protein
MGPRDLPSVTAAQAVRWREQVERDMSYYGPSYANIESGWYRQTSNPTYASSRERLDAVWSAGCDEIVRRYVLECGTFFTAFDDLMLRDIEAATDADLSRVNYGIYYLATRAWEMPDTRQAWRAADEAAQGAIYTCDTCGARLPLTEAHPQLIRKHGVDLHICRPCSYVLERHTRLGLPTVSRVPELMRARATTRRCELCPGSFDLADDGLALSLGQTSAVDVFYPNLLADICTDCLHSITKDCCDGTRSDHLNRLYDVFQHIGRVPTQTLADLVYACRSHDEILELVRLLRLTRNAEGYKSEFGSFLAALIEAGILPEGSRKMVIGTMVLADDGHVCLSIAEKEIDDYLTAHPIAHDKEVPYPASRLRADWEVFDSSERRVFIEYFGLMNNPDYARKAGQKIELAGRHDIELIELYPGATCFAGLAARFKLDET